MKRIHQILPISSWLPDYNQTQLRGDLFAGLTVGIMLIPQGMAYALIAGLPPEFGLYASLVPQLIYALLGTSRQLSVAPVAMDSLLVAAGVGVLATAGTEAYIAYAILLAFFMGTMQLLLGLFQMGFITNLLSRPVISGFTSAAALIIGLNQLKYLLGIDLPKSNQVHEILWSALSALHESHLLTLAIGIGSILLIKLARRVHPQVPGALLAVALGTGLVYFFRFDEQGVAIVQSIPQGLPSLQWPNLAMQKWQELIPLALTIAVVAYMEAYSVAKALESKQANHKVRPNQELIALGAANLVGSLFQAYPVTGGFSRSAVNHQAGGKTPVSGLVAAALVALTLLFLTPLFYYLPKAVLAAVIMVAVASLVDLAYARQLWHDSKTEFALMLLTFLVTLVFSMVPGIVTGIVLSILLLLYRAAYPHIARLGKVQGHHEFRNVKRFKDLEVWEHIILLRIDAPLSFINIQYFKDYIEQALTEAKAPVEYIILDLGPMSHLDASAAQGLAELVDQLQQKQIKLLLCDLIGPVRDQLHRSGLIDILGKETVFLDINEALRYALTREEGRYKDYALQSNLGA